MFQKNNKLIWILFIFLILPLKTFSFLKIDLEPKYVEMDIRKQITKEINVTNQTDQFVRYKVSLKKPQNLKEEYYMGDDLIIYPRVISLKPKGNQIIRLRLKKPIDTKGIDYATKICFDELVPEKSSVSKIPVQEGKVNIQTEYVVRFEMYAVGSSGKSPLKVSLKDAVVKKEISSEGKEFKYLVFKAINQGTKFFRPRVKIKLMEGEKEQLDARPNFFNMMTQDEERDLKIDITRFLPGDRLEIELYDMKEPKNIILKNDIKI